MGLPADSRTPRASRRHPTNRQPSHAPSHNASSHNASSHNDPGYNTPGYDAPGYDEARYGGIDYRSAMARIHGLSADGAVLKDVAVFRRAYELVGLGWLYAPSRWPLLQSVIDGLYRLWARLRLRLTGRPDLDSLWRQRRRGREEPPAARSDANGNGDLNGNANGNADGNGDAAARVDLAISPGAAAARAGRCDGERCRI